MPYIILSFYLVPSLFEDYHIPVIRLPENPWSIQFKLNVTMPVKYSSSQSGIKILELQFSNNVLISVHVYERSISFASQLHQDTSTRLNYWKTNIDMQEIDISINQTQVNSTHYTFSFLVDNVEIVKGQENINLLYETKTEVNITAIKLVAQLGEVFPVTKKFDVVTANGKCHVVLKD